MPRFQYDYSTMRLANGTEPTSSTINIYRAALNKLAAGGFTTRDDLLEKQDDVIESIKQIFPTNHNRRVILSAIFRVLGSVPNEQRVKYYDYFQLCKDYGPIQSTTP